MDGKWYQQQLIYYCFHQAGGGERCTVCDEQEKAIVERSDPSGGSLVGENEAHIPCKICKKVPTIIFGRSNLGKQRWISNYGVFVENGKEIKLSYDNWPDSTYVIHKSCLENQNNPKNNDSSSSNEQSQLTSEVTKEVENTVNIKKKDKDCYACWVAGGILILVTIFSAILFYYQKRKN